MGKYVNGVYVPDPGEVDNRNVSSVQPHSRPVETQNTGGVNPYADRAAVQAAVNQPAQPAPVQQPNLFAQQKQAYQASPQAKGVGEVGSKPYTIVPREGIRPATGSAQGKSSSGSWKPINPNSDTDGMDTILGHFTSPQEEEKYRKASVAQQRILAVADAIRQIGNIYNTTRYAPSQKLNMPAEAVRQRYLQDKALRDQANQRIITYEQAKRAQDLRARQLENEAAYRERQFKFNEEKAARDLEEKQRQFNLSIEWNKEKEKNANDIKREQIKQSDRNSRRAAGLGYANLKQRKEEFEYKKQNGGYGRGGTRTSKGYEYATKNGYVTIPSDYLSKNKINRRSLITEMERAGIIDDAWNEQYDIAQWTGKQDEMLDQAISDWLMTDDTAEQWVIHHLEGKHGGSSSSASSPNDFGGTRTNVGSGGSKTASKERHQFTSVK